MFDFQIFKTPSLRTVEPALRGAFSDGEIALMAGLGTIVHIASGDALINEGTPGTHAFFIATGTAAVTRDGKFVAKLVPGDLVGERALVTNEARNATVTAMLPVTALRFDAAQFEQLRSESSNINALSNDLVAARN